MKWSELFPVFVFFAVVVYAIVRECLRIRAIHKGRYLPFGKKTINGFNIVAYIACGVWILYIGIGIIKSSGDSSTMGWVLIGMAFVCMTLFLLLSINKHSAILTDDRVLFFNCNRQWWKYSNIISAEFKADDKVLVLIHVSGGVQDIDVRPEDVEPVKTYLKERGVNVIEK